MSDMNHWEPIRVTGYDEQKSLQSVKVNDRFSDIVFTISAVPPSHWQQIFASVYKKDPPVLEWTATVKSRYIHVRGFAEKAGQHALDHLKGIVAHTNDAYQKYLDGPQNKQGNLRGLGDRLDFDD